MDIKFCSYNYYIPTENNNKKKRFIIIIGIPKHLVLNNTMPTIIDDSLHRKDENQVDRNMKNNYFKEIKQDMFISCCKVNDIDDESQKDHILDLVILSSDDVKENIDELFNNELKDTPDDIRFMGSMSLSNLSNLNIFANRLLDFIKEDMEISKEEKFMRMSKYLDKFSILLSMYNTYTVIPHIVYKDENVNKYIADCLPNHSVYGV